MESYADYTIDLTLTSPLGTAFQSDTIFGHICWAIQYLTWSKPDFLDEFLEGYDKDESPPLLVSSGFPKGYLPKPIISPPTQKELDELLGRNEQFRNAAKIKTIKEMEIIPKQALEDLPRVSPFLLFEAMVKHYDEILSVLRKAQAAIVEHNTINRIKHQGTDLYTQEEVFFEREGGRFEIYMRARTSFFQQDDLERIFTFIREQGFGRDKYTGKGHFDFEIREGISLPEPENPNGFMTLSSYVPDEKAPTSGHYRLLNKYGKLGGAYAKGLLNRNPFKVPLLMFAPGSTFYDSAYYRGKAYGSLLRGVHHNKKIRHYAYAFPLGITL